jgi:pantoate--beta-alanine ligase
MRVSKTIDETRLFLSEARTQGNSIGFVPTMGYLHEGHLSLLDIAREHSSCVVMSIFVNPMQFSPLEDYQEYPRDFKRDLELASERGVDLVFAPEVEEIYPEKSMTFVEVTGITEGLCGESRPGHFRGVITVVAKLLNIVGPDVAVFGQKDAQQAIAIKRMVNDLDFPCSVIVGPTVRETDGLAMSSRNRYLSREERDHATLLYKSLLEAKRTVGEGEREVKNIIDRMKKLLAQSSHITVDYISITDTTLLEKCDRVDGEFLVAIAAFVGKTRLIDNIVIEV